MKLTARGVAGGITVVCGGLLLLAVFWRSSHSESKGRQTSPAATVSLTDAELRAANQTAPLDYARGLKDALNEADPRQRSIDFGRLLTHWVGEDPAAAIAFLQAMPRGPQFTEGLFILLPSLAKTQPERAVELARSLVTEHEEQAVYSALFDQIARQDLTRAVKSLPLTIKGEGRINALRAVAVAWADQDVLTALEWASKIEDPDERSSATEATLFVRAKRDPDRTVGLAFELLEGEGRDHVVTEAMRHLIAQDARAAAKVVSELPEGDVKTRATLDVVRALAAEQPQTALDWIKSIPSGDLQNRALSNVFDFWSATDPVSAGKYVQQMPNDSAQEATAARLALRWGTNDPASAQRWLNGLSGTTRTTAEINLASGWAQADPAAAMRWATDLPLADAARTQSMKAAMSYWIIRDSAVAESFAKTLPEKDRAELAGP